MRLEYFHLIDRVTDLNLTDRTIRTQSVVPTESTIFEGHFPGHPLMPGVLLIESMAQTGGWLVIGITGFQRMPFLAAVRDAKLRHFVKPGESLSLSAKLLHEGSGFAVAECEGVVDGKTVCDARITFRVMDFPSPDFRQVMIRTAGEIDFPLKAAVDG